METSDPITILDDNYYQSEPPITLGDGMFDYIECKSTREMLKNGYQSVNTLELWKYMKKDTDSYMRDIGPEITKISAKMCELGYSGHSGHSFAWTMRQLQYIAQKWRKKL